MTKLNLPIRTRRLILRRYQKSDFEGLFALQSDPKLVEHVPFQPRTRDEVTEQLQWRLEENQLEAEGGKLGLAITEAGTGLYVGDLLLFMRDLENKCAEIGYMLLSEHQGQGYMTEAVSSLITAAFETYDLHRIVAHMGAENKASAAVAGRAGMRLEAHHIEDEWFKGEWSSTLIYAVLRSEWQPPG